MSASLSSERTLQDQACLAGEQFHKLFYETFDKRRTVLNKLYQDSASMVWNGNPVQSSAKIQQFLDKLPISEHTVDSLDSQPIPPELTPGQTSVAVITSGKVKFEGNKDCNFVQNFTIASTQGGTWKIVSDCFRYQE
ncbi:NTF2-related export protein 2-like [Amphiura filiformis]|uniref:NTF2-related export protein 2-like n=1 Tax=Amphiura filiformis TaxID=82378 RepID=UPI003B2135E0